MLPQAHQRFNTNKSPIALYNWKLFCYITLKMLYKLFPIQPKMSDEDSGEGVGVSMETEVLADPIPEGGHEVPISTNAAQTKNHPASHLEGESAVVESAGTQTPRYEKHDLCIAVEATYYRNLSQ